MFKNISWRVILGIIFLNFVAINVCVYLGTSFEDVSFLFQEREAITFLSALQLGFISLLSLCIYILKKLLHRNNTQGLKALQIWLISFFVFAFATADEFFMLHEGIDGDIATFFFGIKENPHLDGLVLALYGVFALFIFFKFREEILKYKEALFLFCTGGLFFLMSIIFDLRSVDQFKILLEESFKLLAIGFIFSGYTSIFYNTIKELEHRL